MSSVSGELGPATFESIEGAIAALGDKTPMGDAFEHAVLRYLEHDPVVGFKQAWLWDDWAERIDLGLDRDQGVDIVAVDAEGKRIAVQVKFHRDPERNVTQREVATLFSFRSDLFDRWWIVSNAVGRSDNAEKATAGHGDVTWVHRDDLVACDIDWSAALDAVSGKARPSVEPADPREPDQTAAIADTLKALRKNERAQLIMACGTGKTLVTRWITEARKDRLVLVLVPTLLLLKQFRTQWREHARRDFVDLGVCSDADTMGKDDWTVHPDELGVRVTTDPSDIATFLKGEGRRVIFGTYASSARIAEAQDDPLVPAFDLVVADEAHRVAGIRGKGNAEERDTRVVLDGDRIRARRRLFATATPRVYGPAVRARLEGREDIEFASMDDVERFGVEAHRLWFRRAVDLGRLVDYRLSVIVVTDAEVERLVRDRAIVDVQGQTLDAETLASLIALRRSVDELGLTRAISFHHTIKRARDFATELERLELDAPAVTAEHISGAMSMADRQRVLARLTDPELPTVVTNARCLTEGIDVPSLDAIAFVDPRSAPVDIVQAVGRVMRIAAGKHLGHVIVPVFLREEQLTDPEAAIESSAFAPVLAVLRALRAHDPELVSDATRIATSLGRRDAIAGGYISEHIQLLGLAADVGAFEAALGLRFVEVSADRFEVGLAHLQAYADANGHARPPQLYVTEDGFRLGSWVSNRRAFFRKGQLSRSRIAGLEALPGWTWDPAEDDWQEGLQHLRAYAEANGHARPPFERDKGRDPYHTVVWTSEDGSDWRSSVVSPPLSRDGERQAEQYGLARADDGTMVVVGTRVIDDPEEPRFAINRLLLWRSDDGETWQSVDVPEAIAHRSSYPVSILWSSAGFLLSVAGAQGFAGELWTSADGRVWERPAEAASIRLQRMVTDGVTLLGTRDFSADAPLSLSTDGRSWEPVEVSGAGGTFTAMTIAPDGRIVAAGFERQPGEDPEPGLDGTPYVWIGESSG